MVRSRIHTRWVRISKQARPETSRFLQPWLCIRVHTSHPGFTERLANSFVSRSSMTWVRERDSPRKYRFHWLRVFCRAWLCRSRSPPSSTKRGICRQGRLDECYQHATVQVIDTFGAAQVQYFIIPFLLLYSISSCKTADRLRNRQLSMNYRRSPRDVHRSSFSKFHTMPASTRQSTLLA